MMMLPINARFGPRSSFHWSLKRALNVLIFVNLFCENV